jgi:hypothetical protein
MLISCGVAKETLKAGQASRSTSGEVLMKPGGAPSELSVSAEWCVIQASFILRQPVLRVQGS